MAKDNNGEAITVSSGKWKARIPAALIGLALTAAVGALGIGTYTTVSAPLPYTVSGDPDHVELKHRFENHVDQQNRDVSVCKEREASQDTRLQNIDGCISMLNIGLARIETNQTTQKEAISDMQRDIKELLRRQAYNRGGSQ